jgi:hypothetical protein
MSPNIAVSAEAAGSSSGPVFGYFDPSTNRFTPAARPGKSPAAAKDATPSPIVRRGRLIVTVNVKSNKALTHNVLVSVSATTIPGPMADPSITTSISGERGLIRSGSTGVAIIEIPYVIVATAATDNVSIRASFEDTVYMNGASFRETIPLPADGAITRVTLSQRF